MDLLTDSGLKLGLEGETQTRTELFRMQAQRILVLHEVPTQIT